MKTFQLLGLLAFSFLFFAPQAEARDVNAGPIWNQADAQRKCPAVCRGVNRVWNGQWRTTVRGKMSVCGCVKPVRPAPPVRPARDVNAGPIWNQADAQRKCPAVCRRVNRVWNGQWRTTVPGKMSVCGCR